MPERVVDVELLASKREVGGIAGQQQRVEVGIHGRFDDRHEAVRPASAIVTSPPLAVEMLPPLASARSFQRAM